MIPKLLEEPIIDDIHYRMLIKKIVWLLCCPPDMDGIRSKMSRPIDKKPGAEREDAAYKHQPEEITFLLDQHFFYPAPYPYKPDEEKGDNGTEDCEK